MTGTSSTTIVTFTASTKFAFLQHVHENPNSRRVSQTEKESIVEWFKDSHKRPSSQQEFSRRNYVWRTFAWDENTKILLAAVKRDGMMPRAVVTEDLIADVVESVHEGNGHAGWDATWEDVSAKYYGIPRSDVIHLLKQCQTCALKPSKRPKGSAAITPSSQSSDHKVLGLVDPEEFSKEVSCCETR